MKREFHYIGESSNRHKIKVLVITIIAIIIFIGGIIALAANAKELLTNALYFQSVKNIIVREINSLTPAGLFYIGLIGGLFFVFVPQEIFYYYALLKGSPLIISTITVNAGFFLAQMINYFIGSWLSKFFIHIVSKRKLYKTRRFVNKYGSKGVFLFNLLPLPSPLLTFALGITKYNIYRLFFFMLLGTALKYITMVVFFFLTK